jgi:hypothetical protein
MEVNAKLRVYLFPSIAAHPGSHAYCHCISYLCARPIAWHEDGFASKCTHAANLDSTHLHLPSKRIGDPCISLSSTTGSFCLSLSFNREALGLSLRCSDYGIGLGVRLSLERLQLGIWREGFMLTLRDLALIWATARAPSSCLTLLLFSLSTLAASTWACRARVVSLSIVDAISPVMVK